jgi:hypothetical protein
LSLFFLYLYVILNSLSRPPNRPKLLICRVVSLWKWILSFLGKYPDRAQTWFYPLAEWKTDFFSLEGHSVHITIAISIFEKAESTSVLKQSSEFKNVQIAHTDAEYQRISARNIAHTHIHCLWWSHSADWRMRSCVSCDAVSAELVASIFRVEEVTNSWALPELHPPPYCLFSLFFAVPPWRWRRYVSVNVKFVFRIVGRWNPVYKTEITALGKRRDDHATSLYPQKLALTSPTVTRSLYFAQGLKPLCY